MTDTDFCFRYRPWATLFMRRLARRANLLLTISRGDLKRVSDRLGLEPTRVTWLGSGVDDDCIARAITHKPVRSGRDETFVTAGKPGYRYKRVDLTIAACAAAAERLDRRRWTLRVLGMTRDEYARTHGRRIDDATLDRHVDFLGRVDSRDAVVALLRDASQFVLPSRETFGITFLEAVGQCTPIVWLRDHAVDGVFGDLWVGEAAASQCVDHVADAIVATAHTGGGRLGPFERNPIDDLGWDALARRYRRLVLGERDTD